MGIFLDLFLIAIFLLNIILGYKKGLINSIFSICAFFIALILSFALYQPISNIIINNTEIANKIETVIIQNNSETPKDEKTNQNALQQYIKNTIENVADEAKEQAKQSIAKTISNRAIQIITAIIVFIASRIIINILQFLLSGIAKLPIIEQFNKAGGILYGILKSIIIIFILLTILFIVININGNGLIAKTIDDSYITKILYNNNLIVNYCFLDKNLL